MIDRIKINSVNSAKANNQDQPQFKGGESLLNAATWALQTCEANPMVNVAVLDFTTAIVPRTYIEGQTNAYSGLEAFRRESSGLVINCMIPGFIVWGIAKAIQSRVMGGKTDMSKCWANEDTIKLVTDYWRETSDKMQGATDEEKVAATFKKILDNTKGIDGKNTVDFSDFDFNDSIKTYTRSVFEEVAKEDKTKAYKNIIEHTRVGENIKIAGFENGKKYFTQNLHDLMEHSTKILKEITKGNITDVDSFAAKAKKLVTYKSLMGLGVIIPLALAAQPINRWLTEKSSGKKGAPIYKDFGQTETRKQTPKEKAALNRQKVISVGSMILVALASIGKKPDAKMLKNITQFKGIFPTMDQARLISTATFASRMMASEDKNDLREATVRDIATFSSFYFLGDYVAKGIATLIQKRKPDIELINELAPAPKKDASIFKKIAHWTKDTALKSSDELHIMDAAKTLNEQATKRAKGMRALCQFGNIAFSLLALGVLIPKMNRKKTYKEREKELKEMGVDQKTISKYYPPFTMTMKGKTTKKAFEPFFTAQNL